MSAAPPGLGPWQRDKQQELPEGSGTFGLALFFVTLSVLFISAVVGVVVVRFTNPEPEHPVRFPSVGWQGSTLCLIAVSLCVHRAVGAIRIDETRRFLASLIAAALGSVGYLYFQAVFWGALFDQGEALRASVASGFYAVAMLTILHAIHVMGGMIFHGLVLYRAVRKKYWSLQHGQVRGLALYWHFIDGVWLLLLAFLAWICA